VTIGDVPAKTAGRLYGPTVRYADGTLVGGRALDVDAILTTFEQADAAERKSFLCDFAHDLTVAIRAMLLDRPVSNVDLDGAWQINEALHQLTSCINPRGHWSAYEEVSLLRAIIEGSFAHGLDRWVGHALAVAAGGTVDAERDNSTGE
jgi:hypothetical protein